MDPSWGPRIDRIGFGGAIGAITGILLMIGIMADVPATRLWFFISVPIGVIVAIVLHYRR